MGTANPHLKQKAFWLKITNANLWRGLNPPPLVQVQLRTLRALLLSTAQQVFSRYHLLLSDLSDYKGVSPCKPHSEIKTQNASPQNYSIMKNSEKLGQKIYTGSNAQRIFIIGSKIKFIIPVTKSTSKIIIP